MYENDKGTDNIEVQSLLPPPPFFVLGVLQIIKLRPK